jgi:hypothetical protein
MTQRGVHQHEGVGLGLLGIRDPEGSYGTAMVPMGDDPAEAGGTAIQQALRAAGRAGEAPVLILLNPTPGSEEQILQGIQDVVGPGVPILGGSAADNEVAGEWSLFSVEGAEAEGVIVSVLFPSVDVSFSFRSGYAPLGPTGVVTDASGRTLRTIDGQPAAEVYNRWTGGTLNPILPEGGNALGLTSLFPIGRVVGQQEGIEQYQLSHPERALPDGSLVLFTDVATGETLYAMSGSLDSLVSRGGRVVTSAVDRGPFESMEVGGALVTYCAGCMLTVGGRMDEASEEVRRAIPDVPFLGSFTIGEQGCFLGGENRHSNLMISAVVFGS